MKWHLLFLDDDVELCEQTRRLLEAKPLPGSEDTVRVTTVSNFAHALEQLEANRIDVMLLDVRRQDTEDPDEDAGVRVLEAVQKRQFVPVIFYTNVPERVMDLQTPLVRVLEKQGAGVGLPEMVNEILKTGLPRINRDLSAHVDQAHCEYMWTFVSEHWKQLTEQSEPGDLAYLLARRLARSLDGPSIQGLIEALGGTESAALEGTAHPLRYYIIPPLPGADPLAGDIYEGTVSAREGYWIVLTPSCDFPIRKGKSKADWVLLARCIPLDEFDEYADWKNASDRDKKAGPLQQLLKNNRGNGQPERYYYLPAAFTLPDLVVDFQQTERIARAGLDDLAHSASLDSPFAEALLARFSRYLGRLGTPDLDLTLIMNRLVTKLPSGTP